MYRFLVVAVCPLADEYEAGTPGSRISIPGFFEPEYGLDGVNIFAADKNCEKLANVLGL